MKMGVGHLFGRKTPKREEYTSPDKNNILSTLNSLESEQTLLKMKKEAENTNIKCKISEIKDFLHAYHLTVDVNVGFMWKSIDFHFKDSYVAYSYDYDTHEYNIEDFGQKLPTLCNLIKQFTDEDLDFIFNNHFAFEEEKDE